MVAIDTNVIVRLLTADDPVQFKAAKHLVNKQAIFISKSALLESEWVLRYSYRYSKPDIKKALFSLINLAQVSLEDEASSRLAYTYFEKGLDFADALHLASASHCKKFYTFDQKLIKKSQSLTERVSPATAEVATLNRTDNFDLPPISRTPS